MLLNKVKQTIIKHGLIKKSQTILVAVSGGPDSVTLLHLLNALKHELSIKLHIAHLDHGLRKASRADREFVEKLGKNFNIPVTVKKINVKKLNSRKGSLEEIARNARFDFLFETAQRLKIRTIALGHNKDDQAETVLMRLLRGSGLSGLSAISIKKRMNGFILIRPLLLSRKKEIIDYLKKRKIKFRVDTTNFQDIYFRNKIRNVLIPLLEKKYNKNITEILSNTAENAGCDYDYLRIIAEKELKKMGGKIVIKKFLRLHTSIQRLITRQCIVKVQGNTRRITFRHMEEIEDLIKNRPINSIVHLPQGISVIKEKDSLLFRGRS